MVADDDVALLDLLALELEDLLVLDVEDVELEDAVTLLVDPVLKD